MNTEFDLTKPIAIGTDHAGFEYKNALVKHLNQAGYQVSDFGTYSRFLSSEGIIVLQDIQDKNIELWKKLIDKHNILEFTSHKEVPYCFGILTNLPERKIYERYNIVSQNIMKY